MDSIPTATQAPQASPTGTRPTDSATPRPPLVPQIATQPSVGDNEEERAKYRAAFRGVNRPKITIGPSDLVDGKISDGLDGEFTDFPDDLLIEENGYQMSNKLPVDTILKKAGEIMQCFQMGFSGLAAVTMMELALNLKDSEGTEVFKDIDVRRFKESLDSVDKKILTAPNGVQPMEVPTTEDTKDNVANYCCYIAACTLRLFSKSSTNFLRAWDHILNKYASLFKPVTLSVLPPQADAMESLASAYQKSPIMKRTLYHMLYSRNLKINPGILEFVFEMHLSFTGLHYPSIFLRLKNALRVNPSILMKAFDGMEFAHCNFLMMKVIELHTSKDERYKRQMWKFGRIFNKNFLLGMQTNKCLPACYTLAAALKYVADVSARNILNIAQFEDINPKTRVFYEESAAEAIEVLRESIDEYYASSAGAQSGTYRPLEAGRKARAALGGQS